MVDDAGQEREIVGGLSPITGRAMLLLLLLVITACAQQVATPVIDPHLHSCTTPRGDVVECGYITVFENRSTRSGRTIDIHFMLVRADLPGAREAVFPFAGGPGEGSTAMAGMAAGAFRSVRATKDIVFVDQRGTGASHPLQCPSGAAEHPAAVFGHVFDQAVVRRCRDALAAEADITQYTTDLAVADVDEIREALKYDRVSLFGGSYGTRMAQAYLRRYPARVRSVVLDGVVPFDNAIPLTYAASAQQSLDRLFAACAAQQECHAAHPDAAGDLAAILHKLDAGPVAASVRVDASAVDVRMSRGDFGYALRGLLYGGGPPARIADMIGRAASSGDLSDFAQAYWSREVAFDGSLAYGQHFSIFCSEDIPFVTDAAVAAQTAGTFLGRYLIDEYRTACANWRRGAIAPDARTPVSSAVPVLLVPGLFDPVTPPEFAVRVARTLSNSKALVSASSGHGASGGCARPAVVYVLDKGTLDGMPVVCQ